MKVASGTRLTDPKSGQSRDICDGICGLQQLDPAVNCEVRVVTIDETSDVKPLLAVVESIKFLLDQYPEQSQGFYRCDGSY